MSDAVGRSGGWFSQMAMGRHLSYRAVQETADSALRRAVRAFGRGADGDRVPAAGERGLRVQPQGGPERETTGSSRARLRVPAAIAGAGPLAGMTDASVGARRWRTGAVSRSCMRRQGVAGFPMPVNHVPASLSSVAEVSDRDGAILVFPIGLDTQSSTFAQCRERLRALRR